MSERGVEQGVRLAERLSGPDRPVAIYASPLLRTQRTAEIVASALGLPVHPFPAVKEYDFGEASGLTWTEIAERYPDLIAAVRARTAEYPQYPGEEGREAFRSRVCDALWLLAAHYAAEERVAVITHAGPIVVFCLDVLGLPYRRPAPFAIENGSITTIETTPGSGKLICVNDTCHL